MQTPLVLTVIGRDRTGLVETIARLVAGHGGNWLESRMCRLGGEFAGIVRVTVPGERQKELTEGLQALHAHGLNVVVHVAATDAPKPERLAALELVGHDRPGIVRDIASTLARAGANVEELSTELVSAPMSGEILFKAQAMVLLPESCDLASLRTGLEQVAADLMVDLKLTEMRKT